jgi:hypothetical protein
MNREVELLKDAIRRHRDATSDDRCWVDDLELYAALGEEEPPNTALPPEREFLESCRRYWMRRQSPHDAGRCPSTMTMKELEDRIEGLEKERDALINSYIKEVADESRKGWTFWYVRRPPSGVWDEYESKEDAVAAVRKYHGLDPWDGTPHLGRRG